VRESGRWHLTDLQLFLVVLTIVAALFVAAAVVLVALPWPGLGRRLLLLAANLAFLWSFDPLAPGIFLAVSLLGWLAARRAAAGASLGELLLLGAPLLVPLFLPKLPGLSGGATAASGAEARIAAAGFAPPVQIIGPAMPGTLGAQSTLVILVNFRDAPTQPFSASTA